MRPTIVSASRYALAEELGAGGMGVVRAAVDRRLGRKVAIKTLRSRRGQRALERRFVREACVQGMLDHPAIVPVYDIGRDAEGSLFFSMKRVVGTTIDLARLTERQLIEAFTRVCQAVHYAHRRGVVHRDLKPANVMLTRDGEVYVIDWGVAALIDHPDPTPPTLTSALPVDADAHTPDGETVGTPGYLSPEQARGEGIDPRADIYALGAILFELLTLEPLHPRKNTTTILASTLQGRDARPSVRAPHRNTAPELDAICVKATALDPAERYQTLTELVDALEPLLVAEPKPTPRVSIPTPRRGGLARHATWVLLLLLTLAATAPRLDAQEEEAHLNNFRASYAHAFSEGHTRR